MGLKAIRNAVIFQFIDKVNTKGEFVKSNTESGIILNSSVDDSAKTPRWGVVLSVGGDCEVVEAGQQILIPALRWTPMSKIDGMAVWKTDETEIVATRDNETSKLKVLNKWVVFKPDASTITTKSATGLIVVGGEKNTAMGQVVATGKDCEPALAQTKILFSEFNFFDNFVHGGMPWSFIKEDDVLAYVENE